MGGCKFMSKSCLSELSVKRNTNRRKAFHVMGNFRDNRPDLKLSVLFVFKAEENMPMKFKIVRIINSF